MSRSDGGGKTNLANDISPHRSKIFSMVREIRQSVSVPMAFMTYANVVFSYGTERFLSTAAEIGMDGLIMPDVPFEEKAEFSAPCEAVGLDLISLIAPTSVGRVAAIAKEAKYCVSSLGVTGVRGTIATDIGTMTALVRAANPEIPCAVGFGISTPEQAAAIAKDADGVIVGSAIVKRDAVPHVREMKDALWNVFR